jgi:hypothetical protein
MTKEVFQLRKLTSYIPRIDSASHCWSGASLLAGRRTSFSVL